MQMTLFWHCKVKLFPKMQRTTYGAQVKEIVELNPPEIKELGRRLVCYK